MTITQAASDRSLSQTVWCSRRRTSGQAGSAVLPARQFSVRDFQRCRWSGGTGHRPVLGGNLLPSRTHDDRSPFSARVVRAAVGRVARQNGPVARSTRNLTAPFRLRACLRIQPLRRQSLGGVRLSPGAEMSEGPPAWNDSRIVDSPTSLRPGTGALRHLIFKQALKRLGAIARRVDCGRSPWTPTWRGCVSSERPSLPNRVTMRCR